MNENSSSGIVVQLNFSNASAMDDRIILWPSEDSGYSTSYTTNPPMQPDYYGYYLPLFVPQNITGTQFTIIPINNNIKNSNYSFDLAMHSGSCLRVAPNTKYTLTIVDDD